MSDQEQKEIVKQAIKEWMDEQVKHFGWFILTRALVAGLTLLTFYYLSMKGVKIP